MFKMETLIEKAEKFAEEMHKEQKRKYPKTEDYITHPKAVAEIVKSFELEEKYVVAALLHDTVEDTKATIEDVKKAFGEEIAEIVAILTKCPDKEEYVKRFLTCNKNIALVKLADVYHNSQTLKYLDIEKQKKAKYFAEKYYLPIAKRLNNFFYLGIKENIENIR